MEEKIVLQSELKVYEDAKRSIKRQFKAYEAWIAKLETENREFLEMVSKFGDFVEMLQNWNEV